MGVKSRDIVSGTRVYNISQSRVYDRVAYVIFF